MPRELMGYLDMYRIVIVKEIYSMWMWGSSSLVGIIVGVGSPVE